MAAIHEIELSSAETHRLKTALQNFRGAGRDAVELAELTRSASLSEEKVRAAMTRQARRPGVFIEPDGEDKWRFGRPGDDEDE
jgi:hypothetical protein